MITAARLREDVRAFDALPAHTLSRIASAAMERRFARGATLYRAGDPADGLHIVLSGRVHVARETGARTEFLHGEGAGGILGEIPLFGGGAFPASATAVEPTRSAFLPKAAIERLLAEDSAFARFALQRLAERARGLLKRIDDLTATTITARVADYLLTRAESLGGEFSLGMSQEALARELGTAREVVVRALRSLVAAGAITRTGRSRFAVERLAALRAIAPPR
jgi:CRP/FNR family transcriptional regulator